MTLIPNFISGIVGQDALGWSPSPHKQKQAILLPWPHLHFRVCYHSAGLGEPITQCDWADKQLSHVTWPQKTRSPHYNTLSLSLITPPSPKRHPVLTLHGSNLQTVTFNTRQSHTLHFSLGNVARPPITTTASLSLSSQPTPVAHVGRLTQLRYVPRDNCRL